MKPGILILMLSMALSGAAEAHTGEGMAGGLASGFLHPIFG